MAAAVATSTSTESTDITELSSFLRLSRVRCHCATRLSASSAGTGGRISAAVPSPASASFRSHAAAAAAAVAVAGAMLTKCSSDRSTGVGEATRDSGALSFAAVAALAARPAEAVAEAFTVSRERLGLRLVDCNCTCSPAVDFSTRGESVPFGRELKAEAKALVALSGTD